MTTEDISLLGKTLGDALAAAGMAPPYFFMHEPPGIARCIEGHTVDGHQLRLYFRRGSLPFDFRNWSHETCAHIPVIGVARCVENRWLVCGETMLIQPADECTR